MKASIKLLEELLNPSKNENWTNTDKQIKEKENKLNLKFPIVLKEYYRRFGKCEYITQGCNNFYEPLLLEDIFVPKDNFSTYDKEYLIFYRCEESVIFCGIRIKDLILDDPPVYISWFGEKEWKLFNISLENFLVMTGLKQIVHECRFSFYSCSLLCLEALDYEEIFNLQGYELEDYMIEWTDWRIYLKDSTLIGLEVVSDNKIDRNVVIYVSITSNEKERMLKLIGNKKLRWEQSNIADEVSAEEMNLWVEEWKKKVKRKR